MNALEYELSENDLLTFQMYHVNNSPLHKRRQRRRRIIIPIFCIFYSILPLLYRSYAFIAGFLAKEFVFVYIGKAMALVIPEHKVPDDALDAFITELLERTGKSIIAS